MTEEEYIVYRKCKDEVRREKEVIDEARGRAARKRFKRKRKKAFDRNVHVFTQDIQAVKLAMCVNASTTYYQTKLQVKNLQCTILEHNVVCY